MPPNTIPSRIAGGVGQRGSLTVVSVLIGAFYVGSMLPTPLYPAYARAFGFSEITVTLIYAAYVIGNVTALLIFGKVSDQAGRRRISLPALAMAALSALCFLLASSTAWLFAARILSGLAVGGVGIDHYVLGAGGAQVA